MRKKLNNSTQTFFKRFFSNFGDIIVQLVSLGCGVWFVVCGNTNGIEARK